MPDNKEQPPELPKPGSIKFCEDLLYSLTEGIIVFDEKLNLVSANRAAEEMALIQTTEQKGRHVDDVLGKANKRLAGLVVRTLESARPHTSFSDELLRADGNRVPVEASGAPI